jgi:acetoin:2,6-dichlorophenolindophenol oxidoreductase subunit alpha
MAARLSNINVERLRAHHLLMHRIRAFEEAALRALDEKLVLGAIHPSIGQEAVAVGVMARLAKSDLLLSTHRGHGHTLAKGASSTAMMHELLGKLGGTCGGKGGSMHIADFGVGMLGANGVVAANIVIAAGAAHAVKLMGDERIVACFFGDGAANRGPFLEGLNWAAVFKLPVLFVCEDNGYAATTRTRAMTAGPGLSERARALGVPAVEVDGNDVLAVEAAAAELTRAVRAGEGPRFLHAETYRLTGHTGADPATYRAAAEVEAARGRDPIARAGELLASAGVPAKSLEADQETARAEMERALVSARNAPFPLSEAAFSDVQDVGSPLAEAY